MEIISTITNAMGGSILGGIKDLVRTFKLPPEEQLKAEIAFSEHESKLTSVVAKASSDAIQAEANSGDVVVRRARPFFLYIMYAVLVNNFIIFPYLQYYNGLMVPQLIELPEFIYWLFGSGYLGYTGARSWDKYGGTMLKKLGVS